MNPNALLHPKALRYLTAVAQLGSVQAAAREVSISASAIDRQKRSSNSSRRSRPI